MAKTAAFDNQLLQAWNEWEDITGASANDPDDFITWALENKRLGLRPQDLRKVLRKQVSRVLRQATRMDDDGFAYKRNSPSCSWKRTDGSTACGLIPTRAERRTSARKPSVSVVTA